VGVCVGPSWSVREGLLTSSTNLAQAQYIYIYIYISLSSNNHYIEMP
jgi:hypothetical protein